MKNPLRILAPCVLSVSLVGIYLNLPGVAASQRFASAANTLLASNACAPLYPAPDSPATEGAHHQVLIGGSSFTMGHDNTYAEERPARKVTVGDFYIDTHEVTNAQFRLFVEATGYKTTAERQPDPALYPDIPADRLVPGSANFVPLADRPKGQWRNWWTFIEGANWRHPDGPGSDIKGMEQYPVVHVSYKDAKAYADWVGRALPTEAQWEFAAQASAKLENANTWQGVFPMQDSALDGHEGIAPVGCYNADESGLFDMRGNVWELVADVFSAPAAAHGQGQEQVSMRVIKGGSFLCSENFCQRDRPQARQGQEEDFSTGHVGFRTVSSVAADSTAL